MKKVTMYPDTVKLIALMAMTVDHVEKVFWEAGWLSNTIGRWAFPVFSFLLIQNFYRYHPVKRYIVRLGIFGVLTSLLLMLFQVKCTDNVLLTFLCAVIFLASVEEICYWVKTLYWQFYWSMLLLLSMMPLICLVDYGVMGMFFLLSLYAWNVSPSKLNYASVLICGCMMNASGIIPVISTLIILVLLMSVLKIEGQKRLIKWWGFYVYYPLHRVLLYSLKVLL